MTVSVCRTQRVLSLVHTLTACNLKCKGNYRNLTIRLYSMILKSADNITDCVHLNTKEPVFVLRHTFCTSTNVGELINIPSVKKYLDNILQEYKKYIMEETKPQKRLFEMSEIVGLLENRIKLEENLKSLKELSATSQKDEEMNHLVDEEKKLYSDKLKAVQHNILQLLIPKEDFDDCSDVVFEITAGVGGQEAMLFAKNLFDMYSGYIQYKGWSTELADYNSTDIGAPTKVLHKIFVMIAYKDAI